MKFKTHNYSRINSTGTSLVGYINISYAVLKKVFGSPTTGDGYKVDAEWNILFADGTVATIYNYKDGKNYCGARKGTSKTKITNWHVGGKSDLALENIKLTLDL